MAGKYARQRPSKQTTFAVMMVASAVLLLLPWDILGAAKSLSQLAAVPQAVVSGASHGLAEPLRNLGMPVLSAEKHAELVARREALESENFSLTLHIAELQAQINELTRIRKQGFPPDGKLVPAKVIAADALASRGSLLLSKGSVSGVKAGDWILSRRFVDAGWEDGVRKGSSVLARESLIGWVEETEAFTARVVLLSDNVSRVKSPHQRYDAAKDARLVAMLDGRPASLLKERRRADEDSGSFSPGGSENDPGRRRGHVSPDDARLPVAMPLGTSSAGTSPRRQEKKPLLHRPRETPP